MISCLSKTSFKLTAIAAAITMLTACGGSDSPEEIIDNTQDIIDDKKDEPIVDNDLLEGTFVDSAVAGINYVCGETAGITSSEGKFNYKAGTSCTFKIGEIVLGSVDKMTEQDVVVTPFDITEDSDQAVKIGALLQTIDADGNPENGIDITTFDATKLTAEVLSADEETFYQKVQEITGFTPVTFEKAKQHLEVSLGQAKGFHSSSIEDVITKIEGVNDIEQLDLESFLAEIDTILESGDDSNNNDIEVLQAIIEIFEITNDPRVQARIQLETDSDYTKLLPQIIDTSMNSAEAMLKAPTNTTEDISGLFYEMSTRLAAASDTIGKSFEDNNYVANYGEDLSLKAESAYAMQTMALGYSSVMSYFSAYNYGSDDHYLPKTFEKAIPVVTETYKQGEVHLDQSTYSAHTINAEAEYASIDTRPDLLYKDENFGRLHTDKKHLALAKNSLIKLLEVGKKLYNLENDDPAAEIKENSATIDTYIAHLTAEDVSKALINLGTLEDDVEGTLNLQAMYSVDTALDRDDFNINASIDCGQLDYSEDYSKYEGYPMCSSGTYTDGVAISWDNATYIYSDEMSTSFIYAVEADVNIDIEPKSDDILKRFIPECMFEEEDGSKSDCLADDE